MHSPANRRPKNTGSTIRTIVSIDEISGQLFGGGFEDREFGLIILRVSVSDDLPVDLDLLEVSLEEQDEEISE
jgi:hypothetical protein